MSKHRYNGKWISQEEMQKITLARQAGIEPQENQVEPQTSESGVNSKAPKVSKEQATSNRKAIVAELKSLGVKFNGKAKTTELEALLIQVKSANEPQTSESEQ